MGLIGMTEQPEPGVITEAADVLDVSYHLFFLVERGHHPAAIPRTTNGLVDSADRCIVIHTGVHSGMVGATVQVRDSPPTRVDLDDWDEVVEVSLQTRAPDVRIFTLMTDVPTTYPSLTPEGAGDYRVRVYARGRDTDIDGTAFEPFEQYFIQIWPGSPGPETVFKRTDQYGAQLRRFATAHEEAPGAAAR